MGSILVPSGADHRSLWSAISRLSSRPADAGDRLLSPGAIQTAMVCPAEQQAATKPVERAVLLATPAVLPAASVGGTADIAGLATCSTAGESSRSATIRKSSSTGRRNTPHHFGRSPLAVLEGEAEV